MLKSVGSVNMSSLSVFLIDLHHKEAFDGGVAVIDL